jgi:hypothetical protein
MQQQKLIDILTSCDYAGIQKFMNMAATRTTIEHYKRWQGRAVTSYKLKLNKNTTQTFRLPEGESIKQVFEGVTVDIKAFVTGSSLHTNFMVCESKGKNTGMIHQTVCFFADLEKDNVLQGTI